MNEYSQKVIWWLSYIDGSSTKIPDNGKDQVLRSLNLLWCTHDDLVRVDDQLYWDETEQKAGHRINKIERPKQLDGGEEPVHSEERGGNAEKGREGENWIRSKTQEENEDEDETVMVVAVVVQ